MTKLVIAFILIMFLLFMKVPVYASILAGGITYFVLSPDLIATIFPQRVISGVMSTSMLAVPFFIFAGVLMGVTGVTAKVMDFCEVITGHLRGGLAQVNIVLSTLMGGLSGSSMADAAMEAKMLVPEMIQRGYSNGFSSAVTGASAVITCIIPPGIGMVLYGCIAGVSVGRLFIAGVFPGLLLCISMMTAVAIISKKRNYPKIREKHASLKEVWAAFKGAFWALLLPIVIIGGIRIGVFTPTEAGAVACVYSLLLGICYRTVSWKEFWGSVVETTMIAAASMLIVAAAAGFSWALAYDRVPQQLTNLIISAISNKYVFLILINIFLLILGMFIEGGAIMMLLVPLLAPVAAAYGINAVQFGMVFIFNMQIGSLSPPLGTLMFVTCSVTQCKIRDYIKESIPFYIVLFSTLLLISYVPFLTVWLPDIFFG